jgi:hypothetical protein
MPEQIVIQRPKADSIAYPCPPIASWGVGSGCGDAVGSGYGDAVGSGYGYAVGSGCADMCGSSTKIDRPTVAVVCYASAWQPPASFHHKGTRLVHKVLCRTGNYNLSTGMGWLRLGCGKKVRFNFALREGERGAKEVSCLRCHDLNL